MHAVADLPTWQAPSPLKHARGGCREAGAHGGGRESLRGENARRARRRSTPVESLPFPGGTKPPQPKRPRLFPLPNRREKQRGTSNGRGGTISETRSDLRVTQSPEGESSGALPGRNRPGAVAEVACTAQLAASVETLGAGPGGERQPPPSWSLRSQHALKSTERSGGLPGERDRGGEIPRRQRDPAGRMRAKALKRHGRSTRGAARRHWSVARGEPEYRGAAERHAGSVQANTTLLSPPIL